MDGRKRTPGRAAGRGGPAHEEGAVDPRWQGILDVLPDPALVDRGGRIVAANLAMARLVGVERPEAFVGTNRLDLVDPASAALVEEQVLRAIEKGETGTYEVTISGVDGVERQIEVHGTLLEREREPTLLVIVRDVTERRRTERNLRIALERYETLLELSPVAVLTNRSNRIEKVNAALLRLVGARDEVEVVGRPPMDFFHPADHAAIRKRIRAALAGKPIPVASFRVIRLDGAVRAVETISSLIQDDRGKALQVVLRDVTESQLALEALRQSESRFRALAWQAPIGVVEVDLAGVTRFVNPALERITGRGRDELLAIHYFSLIHPADAAALPALATWDHDREPERVYEYRVCRPDGTTRRVRAYGVPLRGSSGRPYGYMGVILDEAHFLAGAR
ncbi:MAG TPA: PAS domain S-box protein [Anaeromyxobacteraceae bacterium]|nr:PAS domain S-box protein [Anaeromyxobacteraceae bacterium]